MVETKPNALPEDDDAIIRLPAVLAVYPVSKSTLYKQIKEGTFPPPVKLGERMAGWTVRAVRGRLTEINKAA